MPANPRSLRITDLYRSRLLRIVERVEGRTRQRWPAIENFDEASEPWLAATAATVTRAQREAVRATSGYLAAYLTSELGRRARPPLLDSRSYAGVARDGRSLTEALNGPLIAVRTGLKDGLEPSVALKGGLEKALRRVELATTHSARSALRDLMVADERIIGWRRAVSGTCEACMGEADGATLDPGTGLRIHPHCQCVSEAVVNRESPAGVTYDGIVGLSGEQMRVVVDDLAARYPGVLDRAWVNVDAPEVGQLAGVSNNALHVSPKFLDDAFMEKWRRDFNGLQVGDLSDLAGARRSVLTHEFSHTLEKHLATVNRAAWDELHDLVSELVTYRVGSKTVTAPRWKAGDLSAPSAYASESPFEYIAEAMNDWLHNGVNAKPISQRVGKLIDGALKK